MKPYKELQREAKAKLRMVKPVKIMKIRSKQQQELRKTKDDSPCMCPSCQLRRVMEGPLDRARVTEPQVQEKVQVH